MVVQEQRVSSLMRQTVNKGFSERRHLNHVEGQGEDTRGTRRSVNSRPRGFPAATHVNAVEAVSCMPCVGRNQLFSKVVGKCV